MPSSRRLLAAYAIVCSSSSSAYHYAPHRTRLAPLQATSDADAARQQKMKDRQEQAKAAAQAEKDAIEEEDLEEIYGYDDDDVNYWADDADDENALTFSTEKATLSGVGDAFGDLTVDQVARDYRFPVAYVADVIAGFGVQPPISDAAVIRDLLDADQAFALLEAVTSLDASEVDDAYVSFGLDGCARRLEADLSEVFALCVDNNFALPHGVETRLRRDQFDIIARTLGWRSDETRVPFKYEDFGYKELSKTAEPLDPDARALQDYVQAADDPTYLDNM